MITRDVVTELYDRTLDVDISDHDASLMAEAAHVIEELRDIVRHLQGHKS